MRWLRRYLFRVMCSRRPDFVIGSPDAPYLERWWVIPRNPLFNVYLHRISRSDDDRALHDHPWCSMTWMLAGEYTEVTFAEPGASFSGFSRARRRKGDVVFRRARTAHRLEVIDTNPLSFAVTLFVTGPVIRRWGFHCPKGWRYWRDFVDQRDKGAIGAGCD